MPADPKTRPIRWPPDRLREPFAPRQAPRPAPSEGVFDPPYRCVLVNEAWISHVVGMVDVLTEDDSWTGEETGRYLAIQQIEAFLNALATGNCSMGITDIRVNGCKLEVEYNDSGQWVEIGDLSACAVPGPPGDPGPPGQDGASAELRVYDGWVQWRQSDDDPTWTNLFEIPQDGPPGQPGLDGASAELRVYDGWVQWRQSDDDPTWTNLFQVPQDGPPGPPGERGPAGGVLDPGPGKDGEDEWCGAAYAIRELIAEMFEEALQQVEASAPFFILVAALLAIIAAFVPGANVLVWAIMSAAVDFILTVSPAAIRAEVDQAFWDAVDCVIFCKRPSSNYPVQATVDEWYSLIHAIPDYPLSRTHAANMLASLTLETIQSVAWLGTQQPSGMCAIKCECELPESVWTVVPQYNLPSDAQPYSGLLNYWSDRDYFWWLRWHDVPDGIYVGFEKSAIVTATPEFQGTVTVAVGGECVPSNSWTASDCMYVALHHRPRLIFERPNGTTYGVNPANVRVVGNELWVDYPNIEANSRLRTAYMGYGWGLRARPQAAQGRLFQWYIRVHSIAGVQKSNPP